MRAVFFGGCGEIGRSCVCLEFGKKRILLDCGVKLGEKVEYPEIDDVKNVDAVILTHAHLDHAGYVPFLVKEGFEGKIYITKPTRDLLQILWSDFLRVARERGEEPYTHEEIKNCLKRCVLVDYGEEVRIGDLYITFLDAGHILGSAQVLVRWQGKRLLYTGDINTRPSRLHKGCTPVKSDFLIMEATYGGKEDFIPSYKKVGKEFAERIVETIEKGGRVLIPVFAIGRAQEVIMTLDAYMRTRNIPEVPVFVDGMVKKACRVYRVNALYLREEIWKRILMSEENPFLPKYIRVPRTESRKDVIKEKPSIIIAPSGMLTGGPSVRYFEYVKNEPESCIIFVGYQGEGTLGRKVLEGEVDVACDVAVVKMSAHADRRGLEAFLKGVSPKECFLMHGEKEKIEDFRKYAEKKAVANAPKIGEVYDLRA